MDTSINGQYPPDKSTSFVDDGQNLLETFWQKEIESIQNLTAIDFRNQELPLARIKKIMKLDEDVKMISAEAPILFAKAAEIFIAELSLRAWANTKDNKRRTLQRNDIAMAISKYDQFDFLIDIVPREEVKPVKRPDIANSNVITSDQLSYFFQVAQQQQQQQPQIQPGPGQPVQIVQTSNQNQSFAISPQVFQVPGNSSTQPQDNSGIQPSPVVQLNASSESQASNSDKAAISSPIILSNVYNNSGEIVQQIPITLSSQQYQTLMQNQNSTQSQPIIINSQSLPVQTQYITNTGQVVQTIIPNNKFSSQREDNE